MKEQIDEIWFRPYDQESYLHTFCEVNYQQYILIVVTDPNFDYFDKHAYERKKYWDSGSLAFFQVLQILSDYFVLQNLDDKLMYIEDAHARRLAVKFRFWIDCQRLYLLLFLGLDDSFFAEERLISSLFRMKKALLALFETYKPAMFEQTQFLKFMSAIRQQILVVQKTLNQRKQTLVSLTKDLVVIINRVLKGEKVLEREAENELWKRISKEIMQKNNNKAKLIEERLFNAVIIPQRINEQQQNALWNRTFVQNLISDAKLIYDPIYLQIQEQKKRQQDLTKKKNRRGLLILDKSFNQPDSKSRSIDKKDRVSTRTKFRLHNVMNRSANYPYTYKNILYNDFFADLVEVKQDNARQEQHDSDMENDLMMAYYEEQYMEKLRNADRNYAKVKKEDLVEVKQQQKVLKVPGNQITVSYVSWKDYPDDEDQPYRRPSVVNSQQQPDTNLAMNFTGQTMEDDDSREDQNEQQIHKRKLAQCSMNAVLKKIKNQQISNIRYADNDRRKFNVYQSKHTRDTRGWGIIRSLYNQLKVNRKIESFLKEKTTYYYVNRMGISREKLSVV